MVPILTKEQRQENLAKGMQIRHQRAEYREQSQSKGLGQEPAGKSAVYAGEVVGMRKRDDYRVAVKSVTLLITIAVCLLIVGLLFLSFCVVEVLVLLFTGGAFSPVFPAIATAVAVLAIMALALVAGGAE